MPEVKETSTKIVRPPIIVVMGHIDHGKTTILDWYRKTKVVEGESGGITQHIGAYELEHKGKHITFIDTPGHEAFSKMRSRGAKIADIAILVVAGDEGVKPQTKEAIKIIQENNLPFVIALNKLDRPEYNAEKVKQELARENILVESYGGKVPVVEISAKNGQNMDALLEMLFIMSELEELGADPQKLAEGIVIEAHLDPKRGITSTLLVLNGTLRRGEIIVIGRSIENLKILCDFRDKPIEEAGLSAPAIIAGLNNTPNVGDEFRAFTAKNEAEEFVASIPLPESPKTTNGAAANPENPEKPIFNIVLKADVVGSLEVMEESLRKMASDEIGINIIRSEVGNIGESDVKSALATKLVTIVGFKVKMDATIKELAEKAKIHVVTGDVIYKLLDDVKENLAELLPPIITRQEIGRVRILKTFKQDGEKQIIGGKVEEGKIEKGALVEIKRGKDVVGRGKVNQLQKDKVNTNEVQKGFEFGVMIESLAPIKEGDTLEIFYEESAKRKL